MKRIKMAAIAGCLALLTGGPAMAGSCVADYQISFDIASGLPGNPTLVSGDICTDGTLGTLGASDIVSWDLTLSDSWNPLISTYTLASTSPTAALNFYLSGVGSPLSATSTALTWTFGDPGAGNYAELIFGDSSSNNFIAWYDYHLAGPGFTDNSYGNTSTSASYGTTLSGAVDFGTIPEPASLSLLGAGVIGLFVQKRSRASVT